MKKLYCDMCGAEGQLYRTKIEVSFLNVCKNCANYGEVILKVKEPEPKAVIKTKTQQIEEQEIFTVIIPNYSSVVKNKREHMNLKQKELAKKIAEKESVIHNIESGHMEPNMDLAKKLEKFLHISLITKYKEQGDFKTTSSETLTIGDLIKKKKTI